MADAGPAVLGNSARLGVGNVVVTEATRRNVADVLDSAWTSPGKWCRRFEQEWCDLHGTRFAVFVNSGTSALQIALAALKEKHRWPDGAGVIVPALTFVASVNTVIQNGLVPVFMDVDGHYGLDVTGYDTDRVPPEGTVAMMVVHLNGQQADMETIASYARHHRLAIIEDSCETVAARYKDTLPGGWGEAACFSTYSCHHVTTGVGGFATTNDPETAALMRSLANHGRDGIYFQTGPVTAEVIAKRFHFERIGYSYRCSEFEAAVGVAQMATIRDDLHARRANADWLNLALADLPLTLPQARRMAQWFPMFYPVLTPRRDALEVFLEERNIETRRFMPLTNQPVYQGMVREADFPMAARVNREGLYVGCFPGADVERLAAAFREFFS